MAGARQSVSVVRLHSHASLFAAHDALACRDRLLRLKHLVVEPRESSGLAAARLDFETKLEGDIAESRALIFH